MTGFHAYHLKKKKAECLGTVLPLQPFCQSAERLFSQLCRHICILIFKSSFARREKSIYLDLRTLKSYADCLMTSGAIQKGVPTKVFLLIWVSVSCPATPKSASFTSPCSDSSTLAAATRHDMNHRFRFHTKQMIKYEAIPSWPDWVGRRALSHLWYHGESSFPNASIPIPSESPSV